MRILALKNVPLDHEYQGAGTHRVVTKQLTCQPLPIFTAAGTTDSITLPPPTTESETVLPLPFAIDLPRCLSDFIRPFITSPFAHFLFRTFPNPLLSLTSECTSACV